MKSGYILAISVFILGLLDFWVQYETFQHTDNDEYSWIMYSSLVLIIPMIGLLMHKRWGLIFLRIILWIWILAAFWMGLIAAELNGADGIAEGMIGALTSHWLQFLLFFGLLFYSRTDKVKADFGIVEKKVE
jgi:hypothetical protein